VPTVLRGTEGELLTLVKMVAREPSVDLFEVHGPIQQQGSSGAGLTSPGNTSQSFAARPDWAFHQSTALRTASGRGKPYMNAGPRLSDAASIRDGMAMASRACSSNFRASPPVRRLASS
jgi:hypothetical protein